MTTRSHRSEAASALALASLGWRVFPCVPRDKKPLVSGWPKLATTNREVLRKWWARWPRANLGIACGPGSNLVVFDVDVDPEKGVDGWKSLRKLEELNGGPLPPTLVVQSRRGEHWYYAYPTSGDPIGSVTGLRDLPGLDVRGRGGFVIAPGSVHESGHVYRFVVRPDCPMRVLRELVAALPVAPDILRNAKKGAPRKRESGWVEMALKVRKKT